MAAASGATCRVARAARYRHHPLQGHQYVEGRRLIQVDGLAAEVPDDFYLTISGQQDKKYICAVVRRGQRLVAVRFIAQPDYQVRVSTSYA